MYYQSDSCYLTSPSSPTIHKEVGYSNAATSLILRRCSLYVKYSFSKIETIWRVWFLDQTGIVCRYATSIGISDNCSHDACSGSPPSSRPGFSSCPYMNMFSFILCHSLLYVEFPPSSWWWESSDITLPILVCVLCYGILGIDCEKSRKTYQSGSKSFTSRGAFSPRVHH